MSWSSQWSLSFWLYHHYPICIPILPHSCYMPHPSHTSDCTHYNTLQINLNQVQLRFTPPRTEFITGGEQLIFWVLTEGKVAETSGRCKCCVLKSLRCVAQDTKDSWLLHLIEINFMHDCKCFIELPEMQTEQTAFSHSGNLLLWC
jgi:hypothetical protein